MVRLHATEKGTSRRNVTCKGLEGPGYKSFSQGNLVDRIQYLFFFSALYMRSISFTARQSLTVCIASVGSMRTSTRVWSPGEISVSTKGKLKLG